MNNTVTAQINVPPFFPSTFKPKILQLAPPSNNRPLLTVRESVYNNMWYTVRLSPTNVA